MSELTVFEEARNSIIPDGNLNIRDSSEIPLMYYACLSGKKEVVQAFADAEVDFTYATIKYMIANEIKFSVSGYELKNTIYNGIIKGDTFVVKHFVKKLEDLDLSGASIESAMHVACRFGHLDLVKYFKSLGMSHEIENVRFILPYEYAMSNGHFDIVRYLETL